MGACCHARCRVAAIRKLHYISGSSCQFADCAQGDSAHATNQMKSSTSRNRSSRRSWKLLSDFRILALLSFFLLCLSAFRGSPNSQVVVDMTVDQGTEGQIFWSEQPGDFSESRSRRFKLLVGSRRQYQVTIPDQFSYLRIDPSNQASISRIFEIKVGGGSNDVRWIATQGLGQWRALSGISELELRESYLKVAASTDDPALTSPSVDLGPVGASTLLLVLTLALTLKAFFTMEFDDFVERVLGTIPVRFDDGGWTPKIDAFEAPLFLARLFVLLALLSQVTPAVGQQWSTFSLGSMSRSMSQTDKLSVFEARVQAFRTELPPDSQLGYLSDDRNTAAFYRMQYALAPRLLDRLTSASKLESLPSYVLAVFKDPSRLEAEQARYGLVLEKDLGSGILLLKRGR